MLCVVSLISWLRKRAERKVPAILRPDSKTDKVGPLNSLHVTDRQREGQRIERERERGRETR